MRPSNTVSFALLFLVLHPFYVDASYWWMESGAFGGNSDTQVTKGSAGGYGGQRPQNSGLKIRGYASVGGGGYPNQGAAYSGVGDSSDSDTNGVSTSGGLLCPNGLTCNAMSVCDQQSSTSGLQERVSNFIPCGDNKVCCSPTLSLPALDPLTGSGSSFSSVSIPNEIEEAAQLPITECSDGWKCVNELFCDATSTMVPFRVELTPQEKESRGKLTPCMNQNTQQFDVCCRKPAVLSVQENNNIEEFGRQELKLSKCPPVNILPPIEQCQGRASNCWSAGVEDTDCVGNALCCFDGCANVCQGEGPVKGNPGPQTNGRGQQRQKASNKVEVISAFKDQTQSPLPINENLEANLPQFTEEDPNTSQPQPIPQPTQPLLQTILKQTSTVGVPSEELLNSQFLSNVALTNQPEVAVVDNSQYFNGPSFIDDKPEQFQSPVSSYPNTQRIIFPEDVQETSFPPLPATNIPSFNVPAPSNVDSVTKKTVQANIPQQAPSQSSGLTAASLPYVSCPSAMKCVPRINCDFNGVMVDREVVLTPDQEALRVPLIPCFNTARGNAVDTCCRDPNYKDPWPNAEVQPTQQQQQSFQPQQQAPSFQSPNFQQSQQTASYQPPMQTPHFPSPQQAVIIQAPQQQSNFQSPQSKESAQAAQQAPNIQNGLLFEQNREQKVKVPKRKKANPYGK